ncbi:MAG: hypothetical protein QM640_09050 [Niabella sp.]
MQEEKLYELLEVLKQRSADVRAEVLLSHLMENGLGKDDFVVHNNGFFFREFAKDIYSLSLIEDSWYRKYIEIRLSRTGFYDMLPEALFHQPETSEFRQRSGVAEMIDRYKKNTAKETDIRKFFQPFENEFFYQQMALENEEVSLLDTLKNKILSAYFLKFWELPITLKVSEAASFLLLFPYASTVNGNLPLMQACLSVLLNESVIVENKVPKPIRAEGTLNDGLGEQPLGDYMICGNEFIEDYPNLCYSIGPLENSKVSDFIEGGHKDLIIQTFNNYFAPVEADIEVEIVIDNQVSGMSFGADEVILGYSTVM